MILTFRPIKVWPEGWPNDDYRSSPFSSTYSKTLALLDRELRHLDATDVILQVDASDRDRRLDGQLRANAKGGYRGCILSFQTKDYGTLTYSCDAFSRWNQTEAWQANLRAIALGLEALRTVERYGIAGRGQQYAGYAELPTGVALGAAMTVEDAARFVAGHAEGPEHFDSNVEALLTERDAGDTQGLELLFKRASKKLHPDVGGDPDLFRKLVQAREVLEAK